MDVETIKTMAEYHYWANRRTLNAVAGLDAPAFTRDLGNSFPSVQATVAHLINAEASWLGRLVDEAVPGTKPADIPDVAAARNRWDTLEARFVALVAGLTAADLDRTVVARGPAGQEFRQPLGLSLLHLFNHGTYHRGQITTMLRQLGARPTATDLIFYHRQRTGQV